MIYLTRKINGITVYFRVKHQFRSGSYPEKIIDVSDGVGAGPRLSWKEALELARELTSMERSDFQKRTLIYAGNTPKRLLP